MACPPALGMPQHVQQIMSAAGCLHTHAVGVPNPADGCADAGWPHVESVELDEGGLTRLPARQRQR